MVDKPIHLIIDFDGTITMEDTISALGEAACNLHTESPTLNWSYYSNEYLADFDAYVKSSPPSHSRTTLSAEKTYLDRLLPVEKASIEHIEKGGVFRGLTVSQLITTAWDSGSVHIRPGLWSSLIIPILGHGGRVSVLSVNWSRDWISYVIRQATGGLDEVDITIVCNDLVVDETGVTTGKLDRFHGEEGLWTATHKLQALNTLIGEQKNDFKTVYIGDSATDLLCLLEVDVGIVMGRRLSELITRLRLDSLFQVDSFEEAASLL